MLLKISLVAHMNKKKDLFGVYLFIHFKTKVELALVV
jgi:hypothetical protein